MRILKTILVAAAALVGAASVAEGAPLAARLAASLNTDLKPHVAAMIAQDRAVYMKPAMAAAEEAHRNLTRLGPNESKAKKASVGMPSGAVYDPDVSQAMLWHSVSAYCADSPTLMDWTCNSCNEFGPFTVTGVMNDGSNQGYVGYFTQGLPSSPIQDGTGRVSASDPFVVIAFRGTVPSMIKDWIEDLSFGTMTSWDARYPQVQVHDGFWNAYLALKPDMLTALDEALNRSGARTILVAGHSLGGAMAELAAMDLTTTAQYAHYNYASYTQGCPRVGNAAFSAMLSSVLEVSFRDTHYADIVPHLPPLALGFVHGPIEIWWDEPSATYHKCISTMSGEDPNCSDSLSLPVSVSDHLTYRGIDLGAFCG